MGDFVAETQKKLGAIITAPKLSEKLLTKPPFRFLHDIVTNFMKATGLLNGLFTDAELNPGKDADKDMKLAILQKVVTVVSAAHNTTCPAKPSKIIAGAEAEQTNVMLVMLAELRDLPPATVESAVAATTGAAPKAAPAPAPKKEQPPPAAAASETKTAPPPAPSDRPQSQSGGRRGAPAPGPAAAAGGSSQSVPQVQALPSSQDAGARPGTATARKPPPAVKSNEVVEDRESMARAPQAQVISEATKDEDDANAGGPAGEDDWQKLVEREEQAKAAGTTALATEANNRGYLASQAAKAKQEQEEAKRKAEEEAEAAGRGTGGIVLKTRKRDDRAGGSIGASEMSKLKEQLQLLTKASNPLGRFLEALHEDVDTMARELDMWRTESKAQAQAAAEARRQTEEALLESDAKQSQLADALTQKQDQITIVRGTILQNDKTIETLIRMVVNPESATKTSSGKP